MFRVFLLVGLAAVPVVALGLIVGPVAAVVVLGFEIGVGIGLLVRRMRQARPRAVASEPAEDPAGSE